MKDFEDLLKQMDASTGLCGSPLFEIATELPEKDRPVLAASIHHRCNILLTGDKTHFGPLYGRRIEGIEVHSPASLSLKLPG